MTSFRIAFVVMAACSGGSSDWVPADIDERQTLMQLGNAGYGRLCSAFEDYVHDQYRSSYLIKAVCTAHAIETTTDAVACGAAVDDCLDTLPPVVQTQLDQILAQASCTRVAIDASSCPSTVSRLKGCLDALGDKVDELQLAATCAAAGSPVPDSWWMISEPAECTSLQSDC